jgi:sucrose-6-phosphate hydrolase SacC (GH32 family)
MEWLKMGLIYAPTGSIPWAQQYAFPPTPHLINEEILRVYVAFRDADGVGRVGFVEVDARNPGAVRRVSTAPVLDIGTAGAFDENGVVPTCVVRHNDQLYMYYVGYQLGYKVRYFQFQGLAISEDGGLTFRRHSTVPIIDRSDQELLNRTSAFVLRDDHMFKMWYVAGSDWVSIGNKLLPRYNLRYLESIDGRTWGRVGRVCFDFRDANEYAFGRPWIVRDPNLYHMFYSIRTRSKGYRLGYAKSRDGIAWQREDDAVGIDVSESGWDSEMIAYPSIYRDGNEVYLFYNGNNCGSTGFGFAQLARPW